MEINFECQKCKNVFNCEIGKIGLDEQMMRPTFEKPVVESL